MATEATNPPETTGFDPQWVKVLRARIDAAEKERVRLRSALETANEARARSLDSLQALRRQSVERRAALEAEIARLRDEMDEANDDRARLRAARQAWLEERKEFQRTIDEMQAALDRLRGEFVRGSRLTRPFRALKSRLAK
jgi:chromosome segregation ATPase